MKVKEDYGSPQLGSLGWSVVTLIALAGAAAMFWFSCRSLGLI